MPISAPDSPSRIAALPNDAAVEAIRMSEARHSARPAPTQGPLTAAMTGWGRSRIAWGSAAIASWKRSRSIAGASASSMPGPKLRMSSPEQKPRPVPVSTTAWIGVVGGQRGERLDELGLHDLVDGVEPLGPVEPQHGDAVAGDVQVEGLGHRHTRSMIVAVPMPPPVHMVTSPVVRSRRSSSSSTVPMSIAPVAPIGWPRAMAPPLTLTRSGSRPSSRIVLSGTAAKASLISQRSMSATLMPARSRQRCAAGPGAVSMMIGSLPIAAVARMRARGVTPWARQPVLGDDRGGGRAVDDARRVPGVVDVVDGVDLRVAVQADLVERARLAVDGRRAHLGEGGLRGPASFSTVVPGRGCSSCFRTVAPVVVGDRDDRAVEAALGDGLGGAALALGGEGVDVRRG